VALGDGDGVDVPVGVAVDVGVGEEVGVRDGVLAGVTVNVCVALGVAVGGGRTPSEIVTTKPLAVAESTETVISLAASLKVSPTVQIAPASPVSPLPSTSTTWAGLRRVVSTSWMITAWPGSLTS